ncbi:MAG TPA: hypothetical protein VJ203_09520 [Bacteroidales bacterium]|nr:hypothetical protein [Bacteroidales bacterium]
MKTGLYLLQVVAGMIFLPAISQAQHTMLRFENQFSGWGTIGFNDPVGYQLGGRFIPTLHLADSLSNSRIIDAELSVNAFGNALFTGNHYDDGDAVLKPYRLWLRYATPRFELRIGLQKINFGSATVLRPLMWFDKIDYRDPLQLTDGVYGFLGRYYFQNNANIWFWVLYGNDESRGWDAVPTQKHIPEFGGRFQLPLGKGETAFSYHHREAVFDFPADSISGISQIQYPENKIGVDGKWDVGIGLWFEGVIKHNGLNSTIIPEWETFFNLGADYTFPLGSGLTATAEYFRYSSRDELAEKGLHNNFTAVAANYPLGIMNSITGMVYYNWDLEEWYRIINLQRKYDYWSFYLMLFWNPDRFAIYNASQDRNLFSGKGMQLMAVVNF